MANQEKNMKNPFQNAMAQLDKVASLKNFNPEFLARLRQPDRDMRITIPVKMDDGTLKIFEGYRVEFNNALGPYKGGIRYHQETEINEVRQIKKLSKLRFKLLELPVLISRLTMSEENYQEFSINYKNKIKPFRSYIKNLSKK